MTTRILGIESSCDETAAAVVADGREVLSNIVASQVDIHRKYGGVVPELASREHLRQIVPVVREALERAGLGFADVDAIAVTHGPGLVGSLLVGITYGKVLAMALGKPLVPVNHLEGHIHAVLLEAHAAGREPTLPAVCLVVSGGHTVLYDVQAKRSNGAPPAVSFRYRRLGQTRDDAAGEAFDKVARLLALGYPGGPVIDQLIGAATVAGALPDADAVRFGPTKMKGNPFDFSFSGIKTAVLYYVRRAPSGSTPPALQHEHARFDCQLPEGGDGGLGQPHARCCRGDRRSLGPRFGRCRCKPPAPPRLSRGSQLARPGRLFPQPPAFYRQRGDDRSCGFSEAAGRRACRRPTQR